MTIIIRATITTEEIDFSVALTNLLLSWFVYTHVTNMLMQLTTNNETLSLLNNS